MNAKKIFLWGLPLLTAGLIIACAALLLTLRGMRQQGWTTYTADNSGLAEGVVTAIAFDDHGRAWIGVDHYVFKEGESLFGGSIFRRVSIFDGENWTTYTVENSGLAHSTIHTIAFDEEGRTWAGSLQGVSVFDGEAWIVYDPRNSGLIDPRVYAIDFDKQDRAWLGTPSGVSIFDGKAWTAYTTGNSGLVDNYITAIAFDEQGRAWLGTPNGLSVFDGEAWTTYTSRNSGLAEDAVQAITFDEQGCAWIGTPHGLSVFDGETWITHYADDAVPGPTGSTFAFGGQDHACVRAIDGVSVFDGRTWTTYTAENSGLVDNDVRAVAFDGQGRVWIGTFRGVSVLSPEEALSIPQSSVELAHYGLILMCLSPIVLPVLAAIWAIVFVLHRRTPAPIGQKRAVPGLWRWWALASAAGLVAHYLVIAPTAAALILARFAPLTNSLRDAMAPLMLGIGLGAGLLAGLGAGAVIGIVQRLALRRRFSWARKWAKTGAVGSAATYAAVGVSELLVVAAVYLVNDLVALILAAYVTPLWIVIGAAIGAIGGAVTAGAQWRVLQRHLPGDRRRGQIVWALTGGARMAIGLTASGIGMSITIYGGVPLNTSPTYTLLTLVNLILAAAAGLLCVAAGGALSGAITGGVLARLLQTPAETPTPEEDTTSPPQDVDSPTDEAVQPLGEEEVE